MKAKKLFLGALLVVLGTSAQAQIVSSQSNRVVVTEQGKTKTVEPIKQRESQWYVKAGVSMDKLAGSESETYDKFSNYSVGYDVSFGFIKPIKVENMFWGAELGLMSIGCKTKNNAPAIKVKKQNAIILSPFVGYDVVLMESLRISPYIGPYLSYALNKSESKYSVYYGEVKISNKDTKLSGGVNVGVGFWIGDNLNVDIHYRRALLKNMEGHYFGPDFEVYSQKIVLGLGWAF